MRRLDVRVRQRSRRRARPVGAHLSKAFIEMRGRLPARLLRPVLDDDGAHYAHAAAVRVPSREGARSEPHRSAPLHTRMR